MRNKRVLRAALESRIEEVTAELAPAGDVVVAQVDTVLPEGESVIVVDSADVELEAVRRAQAETVDTVDAIDQLVQAADQLDGVRSNIAATLPNGGLTQGEAVAYATATDVITADLGVKEVIPAMENFGGSMSRLQATQESLSSVTAVIKRIVGRALELLDSLLERIGKLAVRIVEYFTSDKSRLAKYEQILAKADRNRRVSFKVSAEDATLLGLSGNGFKSVSSIETLFSTLALAAQSGVELATNPTPDEFSGKAKDLKGVLSGGTRKEGNVVKTEAINGVQIIETLPSGDDDFTSYDLELVTPDIGESSVEVTVSVADLQALLNLLNSTSTKVLSNVAQQAKGAKIGANVVGWFANKFGEEEAAAKVSEWRHVTVARASLAPAALGVVNRIVQASMSVLRSGSAKATTKEVQGLPNKA